MSKNERFVTVYKKSGMMATDKIIVDTHTGVNYYYHQDAGGYSGGITPLLDSDGKPVVSDISEYQR